MRRIAIAILFFLVTSSAPSADRRNFWVLNLTRREVQSVYVSPHGTDDTWGSDILGQDTVPNGGGVYIAFNGVGKNCIYDVRLDFNDGSHQDYTQGRNLCEIHAIQFNKNTSDAY
jgi:hypothetical protein